jgi:hypothetical protein
VDAFAGAHGSGRRGEHARKRTVDTLGQLLPRAADRSSAGATPTKRSRLDCSSARAPSVPPAQSVPQARVTSRTQWRRTTRTKGSSCDSREVSAASRA